MDWSWLGAAEARLYIDFPTSLAIGLLIGLERERNPSAKAGLRTFALVALFGAICGALSDHLRSYWLLGVGLAMVGFMIIAAYLEDGGGEEDPGTTTMAAILVCFSLGAAVTLGFRQIAVMLAIVTTALLYFKTELSRLALGLERRELLSILQFAALTFIILPILPDRNFGPYEALNLRNIWLMVVLISGISLAGYLALRIVGQRHGLPMLGLLGGLVSSTATTLVYARHSKGQDAIRDSAVVVILLANLMVLGRLALLTWVTAPALLPSLLPVMLCALAAGSAGLGWFLRHLKREESPPIPQTKNPTELKTALAFAIGYAAVLLLAAWLNDIAGTRGLYGVALVSGLTDVDAITLSSLRLFGLGDLQAHEATTSIMLALISNLCFKLGVVVFAGDWRLFQRCALSMGAMAVAAGAGLVLFA
jgi:uncharacterized membrane protein (DUF4010 family)